MFKKIFKSLKRIDIFSQPAYSFSTNRNKLTNEKKFAEFHGSILGGIVSLFFIAATVSYIYNQFDDMLAGNNDNKNTQLNTNPMNEITNAEFLTNSTFYPTLDIRVANPEKAHFDFFSDYNYHSGDNPYDTESE